MWCFLIKEMGLNEKEILIDPIFANYFYDLNGCFRLQSGIFKKSGAVCQLVEKV